jgi:glycosyltransferase involved in cell wall biosynthesis
LVRHRTITVASDVQGVSIIVPCYNEEAAIEGVLADLQRVMDASDIAYELIAIDDGSTDRTSEALHDVAGSVRVLHNKVNRGYGATLKRGIRHARMPLVCIIDSDGTYPTEVIPTLVRHACDGETDMVVAARKGDNVAIPLIRRPAKWVLGRLANFVASERIDDMNSGLRVFPRLVAEQMMDVLPDGFSFTTTITLAMLTNGYTVEYRPIDYHARVGRSKIRPIRDTLIFLELISKMALYFAPLKLFLPLSLGLFLLAVAWGTISALALGRLADVSTLVLAVAAVHVGAIGLLAELIRWRMPTHHVRD